MLTAALLYSMEVAFLTEGFLRELVTSVNQLNCYHKFNKRIQNYVILVFKVGFKDFHPGRICILHLIQKLICIASESIRNCFPLEFQVFLISIFKIDIHFNPFLFSPSAIMIAIDWQNLLKITVDFWTCIVVSRSCDDTIEMLVNTKRT